MKSLVLILSVVLASCISYAPPKEHPVENSRTFNANYDKIWTAVISTFATNNIPIKNIEKSSGLITTDRWINPAWAQGGNLDADCGEMTAKGSLGKFKANIYVTFNIFIQTTDSNSTLVQINTSFAGSFDAIDAFGNVTRPNYAVASCYSTGKLEKRIFDMINSKIPK